MAARANSGLDVFIRAGRSGGKVIGASKLPAPRGRLSGGRTGFSGGATLSGRRLPVAHFLGSCREMARGAARRTALAGARHLAGRGPSFFKVVQMLRVAAAYHEASHLIIARSLGCSVGWATVDDRSGRCGFGVPVSEHDEAVILLAGSIGQHIAVPRSPLGRSDFQRLAAIQDADQHRTEAQALVRRHWPEIKRLAVLLLEQGAVGADEIGHACAPQAQWVG